MDRQRHNDHHQTEQPSPQLPHHRPQPLLPADIGDGECYGATNTAHPHTLTPEPAAPAPVPAPAPAPARAPDVSPALQSHSSSFEADDERSATGPHSSYSPFVHPSRGQSRSNNSDSSSRSRSRSRSTNLFRMAGHRATGRLGAGDDNSNNGDGDNNRHRPPPRRARRRRQHQQDVASYAGEDSRPTSSKEILGWYMYSFASETYVVCAIASFIPILLESLARENGVLLSDRTTPCNAAKALQSSSASLSTPSSSSLSTPSTPSTLAASSACVIYVLGVEINTASFAMYTFSASVLLQALLVVSISCAADHGNYRKTLLLVFAAIGSVSVMLFFAVTAQTYLLGAFLAIISNTSFGASIVLLNSFLPLLVRHHPAILDNDPEGDVDPAMRPSLADIGADDDSAVTLDDSVADPDDSTTALLPSSRSRSPSRTASSANSASPPPNILHEEQTSAELTLSTQLSARGVGIGYCAALFVQCVAIAIVFRMHNTTLSQRVVLLIVGIWWATFSIPTALWLRPRPGPPLPAAAAAATVPGGRSRNGPMSYVRSGVAYLVYAWASLFRTIALARRLRDIVLFLAGWFLLSDAIATTSSTAVLFAKTELHMEVWALGLINVISTMMGIAGALGWAAISRRVPLLRSNPLNTILACLALFELIPLYGLIGYLPLVRKWGVGGLQQPWEMYVLAAVFGFVIGGFSSYCRSLYGELIPPGSEAAFYALYAITDKGSSIFGPAIVGAIIDATGDIRPAFWFLIALVGLPAPLLYFVDVERGRREGEALAAVIEGFRPGGGDVNNYDDDESGSAHTPRAILADYDDDDDDDAA